MSLLYIDPGTGSMLFAALLGIFSTLFFVAQKYWVKAKFFIHGGRYRDKGDAGKKSIVIFGEDGRYWNVFKPVCDELEKRSMECEYYTMDEKDPLLLQDYEFVHPSFIGGDNRAFAKLNMMKADICLATTPGLEVYQWKKSKNVGRYVHIFHTVDEGTGYKMFGIDDYDAVLLTGAFQERYIRMLEEMRNESSKEVKVVGSTYLDSMLERLNSVKGEECRNSEDLTVLLAPSWGKSSILSRFGEKIIDALLETGYKIIIRPHPQTRKSERNILDPLLKKYGKCERIEWDESNDNFNSLRCADVMITDYSGVIFDYAFIFNKPVIFADTELNTDPYDAAWIDEPVWRIQILDDLGIRLDENDFGKMKDVIDNLINNDHYQAGREKIRDVAWQNRGHAAEAVVDYLEAYIKTSMGENDGTQVETNLEQ